MATVLVVDDDKVSRKVLNRILQNLEHEAILADSNDSGWRALTEAVDVDLVILDNLLKNEYGWELLSKIRKDLIYKDIPVLIYSASSDRSSVIKYLQLGVQNIQTKPFKPAKIKEEVERSLQVNWRNRFFEPSERVCTRLNITDNEYYRLLNSAADEIRGEAAKMKQLIGTSREREFLKSIDSLRTFAANLGISLLDTATDYLTDYFEDQKISEAVKVISHLETMTKLMQYRFSSHFGIATEDDSKGEKDYQKRTSELRADQKKDEALRARQKGKTALNKMLAAPLSAYATDILPLLQKGIFSTESTLKKCTDPQNTAADHMMRLIKWSLNPNNNEVIPLETSLEEDLALCASIREITNFRKKEKTPELNLVESIDKLGINRSMSILLCHRLWKLSKQLGCAINTLDLARNSLGSALIAHELTQKLKQSQPFAQLGVLQKMGTWLLCLIFPGYYGLTLSLCQGEHARLRKLESSVFGLENNQLGATFLKAMNAPQVFIDTALYCNHLSQLPPSEHTLGPAFIQLSNALAHIFHIGFDGTIEERGSDAFIQSPAWEIIKGAKIKMPLEPDELLNALIPIFERINWQVMTILPG